MARNALAERVRFDHDEIIVSTWHADESDFP
jgi:hypothetical protein